MGKTFHNIHAVPLNSRKEGTTDTTRTWLNLKHHAERSQKQKTTYCIIRYVKFWKRQYCRDKVRFLFLIW